MKPLVAALLILLAQPVVAQHQPQHDRAPYAGLHQRHIKALSDQQVSDLKEGRGMQLALAAELNGYPGPLHVLELADQLNLSVAQRERLQQFYNSMKSEAMVIGQKLLEQERALDQEFARRVVTPESLAAQMAQIGRTQGELRGIHLKYHLSTAAVLSESQSATYAQLRGYR